MRLGWTGAHTVRAVGNIRFGISVVIKAYAQHCVSHVSAHAACGTTRIMALTIKSRGIQGDKTRNRRRERKARKAASHMHDATSPNTES